MMDHVTQDLNSYLDKLDIQCLQQNEREHKIERIMKKEKIKKVIELFNNDDLTIKYMQKVIKEWKYSCER